MARYILQGQWQDGQGVIVQSGTVSVYLAGTTTAADVYTASSGGTAVNSVTSDSNGAFSFFVDTADYAQTQNFKITLSKTNYQSVTYDNIKIFPAAGSQTSLDSVSGKYVNDLFDGGYDVAIKPQYIFGGANNTVGHTVPNVADDTFTLNDATQNLNGKTLITPVLTTPDINGGTVDSVTSLTVANNVDIGNFDLQAKSFTSDVATGTAPLTVSSTTAVTNLRSEMTSEVVDQGGGNNVLMKIVNIGDWDMDASVDGSLTVVVAHGVTAANIRKVEATIRNDAGDTYYDVPSFGSSDAGGSNPIVALAFGTNITLSTVTAINKTYDATNVYLVHNGLEINFDSTSFDSTSYNRGWLKIWYTE